MSLQEHGIEVVLDANGVLNITGPSTTPIRFNGRPMIPERPRAEVRAPAAQFWNPDGTQTSERPMDLRGEN